MNGMRSDSLQRLNRASSFDSVDSSFDVVSMDESIEEHAETEDNGAEFQDGEWEDLTAVTEPEDVQVQIELDEGFHDALEAALETTMPQETQIEMTSPAQPATSPRRRSARETLRDFYLARAKTSEEKSKNYRTYEPQEVVAPAEIPPLRAPECYDVELYERMVRMENERKAQQALRDFYAQREAIKARRASENRTKEPFVYQSQIGSSMFLEAPEDSIDVASFGCTSVYWETTKFVINSNEPANVTSTRPLST